MANATIDNVPPEFIPPIRKIQTPQSLLYLCQTKPNETKRSTPAHRFLGRLAAAAPPSPPATPPDPAAAAADPAAPPAHSQRIRTLFFIPFVKNLRVKLRLLNSTNSICWYRFRFMQAVCKTGLRLCGPLRTLLLVNHLQTLCSQN